MGQVLMVAQIVVSIIVIGLILIQARGTGFARSQGSLSSSSFSRRGLEKLTFKATFVFVAVFIAIAILQLVL